MTDEELTEAIADTVAKHWVVETDFSHSLVRSAIIDGIRMYRTKKLEQRYLIDGTISKAKLNGTFL